MGASKAAHLPTEVVGGIVKALEVHDERAEDLASLGRMRLVSKAFSELAMAGNPVGASALASWLAMKAVCSRGVSPASIVAEFGNSTLLRGTSTLNLTLDCFSSPQMLRLLQQPAPNTTPACPHRNDHAANLNAVLSLCPELRLLSIYLKRCTLLCNQLQLAQCPRLSTVRICGGLSSQQSPVITFQGLSALTHLSLDGGFFGGDTTWTLGELPAGLKSLRLCNVPLHPRDRLDAQLLSGRPELEKIVLAGYFDAGLPIMPEVLGAASTLRELSIAYTVLKPSEVAVIGSNTSLRRLTLEGCGLGNEAVALLSLDTNSTLEELALWGNSITDPVRFALASNSKLSVLDVGHNPLHSLDFGLARNSTLRTLLVSNLGEQLSTGALHQLTTQLRANRTLERLVLRELSAEPEQWVALNLEGSSGLVELDIVGNRLELEELDLLGLDKNKALKRLHVSAWRRGPSAEQLVARYATPTRQVFVTLPAVKPPGRVLD